MEKNPQPITQARPIGRIHGKTLPMNENGEKDKQTPPVESKEPMDSRDMGEDVPNLAAASKEGASPRPLIGIKERKAGK